MSAKPPQFQDRDRQVLASEVIDLNGPKRCANVNHSYQSAQE
jgi:hypothetical protein